MTTPDPIRPEARRSLLGLPRSLWIGLAAVSLVATVWVVFWLLRVTRGISVTNLRGDVGGLGSMDKNAFLIHLSESKRTDVGKVDFEQQDEVQRVFSAIWRLESEVNNGGFDQYFLNTDSVIIEHAPKTLGAIGAKSCARIVEHIHRVAAPLSRTRLQGRAVTAALDALSDEARQQLESLDSEFFKCPDNLTELLFDFVSRHSETFGPVSSENGP